MNDSVVNGSGNGVVIDVFNLIYVVVVGVVSC